MVKDLSRLGRNTIDTGYYIEKYFPLHQVRFIAVNDQYDSEDGKNSANHMIVPLKNMINEAYAADISRKVAAQQRQAMRDGDCIGSRPPYGYRKDPDSCHRLLVNEDTAPTVRQIFQWAADGVALNDMVKRLNEGKVPTPGYYLASIGLITSQRLMGSGKWQTWTVGRILEDEVYTGDMVQGKSRTVGRKQVPTAPADWIVARDTHADWYFFTCLTNNRVGADRCTGMYVRDEDIFSTIYYQLKLFVKSNSDSNANCDARKAELEREAAQCREMLADPMACTMKLYEQLVLKELDKDTYLAERAKVYAAKERLEKAESELEINMRRHEELEAMHRVLRKELPLAEILGSIDSIVVSEGRKIEVKWREMC